MWNGGKMLDLGALAALTGVNRSANGINDTGHVVGQYGSSSGQQALLSATAP